MGTDIVEQADTRDPIGCCIPVLVVHGWKSHPGVWKPLVSRLREEAVPVWVFDHADFDGAPVEETAILFREFIGTMRRVNHYTGQVDIVCHSMGTGIARYLLEVLDRESETDSVRQLIGLGPPNNGSAMAELFNHPVCGPRVIERLTGIFVSRGYNPVEDPIVQQFRPGSTTMNQLKDAGIRDDIRYRIILTANKTGDAGFFPPFKGKTWELSDGGTFRTTYLGDGIVSHSDSVIKGASVEILPKNRSALEQYGDQYCHIRLPGNPEVIETILAYLKQDGI